jgi:hypothetical protein
MDILQTHFMQQKNKNKLFFKVDLGEKFCQKEEDFDARENFTYSDH